jgi:hypothetical protein
MEINPIKVEFTNLMHEHDMKSIIKVQSSLATSIRN